MYSVEYKCTKLETPQTTNNIVVDKGSKKKPQLTLKSSELIHWPKFILHVEPITAVSNKANKDKKKS